MICSYKFFVCNQLTKMFIYKFDTIFFAVSSNDGVKFFYEFRISQGRSNHGYRHTIHTRLRLHA